MALIGMYWMVLFYTLNHIRTSAASREFFLGPEVLSNNVSFNVHLPDGLYSLGKVEEDGYLESVCAFGEVDETNERGILFFYVIRRSGNAFTVENYFNMIMPVNNSLFCKNDFGVQHYPKKDDYITVFITRRITFQRNEELLMPAKIAFKNKSPSIMYFEGSDVFMNEKSIRIFKFDDLMRETIETQLSSANLRTNNIALNVRVTLLKKSSCGRKDLFITLIAVVICVFLALLGLIVLLIVKLFKRKPRRTTNKVERSIEIPSIKVSDSDTEDATTTDREFSDVQYLLQKDAKRAVININHYHGSHQDTPTKAKLSEKHVYSLLTNPDNETCDSTGAASEDHDYDEPYFEPACTEETLLTQLKSLGVPLLAKQTLRLSSRDLLGQGAFGSVYKGVLYSVHQFNQLVEEEVAVKTMEDGASEENRIKFLQEAAIMGQFIHPNIIKILGIVITPESCKIVIEVMARGDLRNHLQTIKPNDIKYELAPTLLSYSRHVANGMMYLAVKAFVHRDLAARNVLVAENGVCKIADFGLSRKLQDEDYYVSHGGKIPVKWTAPEALHYRKYSNASDIWSYGCVLYEIWSLGKKPYQDLTNEQIIEKLTCGFRLSPPPGCPRDVYQIMMQCWNPDPLQRPSFMDISSQLQKPDYQVLKWSEEDNTHCCNTTNEAKVIGATLEAGAYLHQDLQKAYVIANQ